MIDFSTIIVLIGMALLYQQLQVPPVTKTIFNVAVLVLGLIFVLQSAGVLTLP